MSRKISVLAAAVLAAVASAAGAVSLGELEVQSVPGEPFEATLDIKDVDLTISPLLVRVAPPATYLREGVQWPQEALDLRMARMKSGANVVRVRVTGKQSVSTAFPLLIEMNAGGNVTVREYLLDPAKGAFIVTSKAEAPAKTPAPAPEAPKAEPAPAKEAVQETVQKAPAVEQSPERAAAPAVKAVKSEPKAETKTAQKPAPMAAPSAATAEASQAPAAPEAEPTAEPVAKKPHRRIGRSGPVVVREYVALNGFNPNESFPVQLDMTLWSIAKLYWPSYPGALLEQVAAALTEKNTRAFIDGDPSKLVAGGVLASPTSEEVFAVDPLEAFRRVHGAGVEVPGPTQNLIDAQRRSHTAAAEVAAVQLAEAAKGAKSEAVAAAGRKALAEWEAENDAAAVKAAEEKAAAEKAAEVAKAAEAAKAEEAAKAAAAQEAAKAAEAAKTAAPQVEEKAPDETKTAPEADAQTDAQTAVKDAAESDAKNDVEGEAKASWRSGPLPWVLLVLALGAALYAFTRRRKEETAIEQPPRKTKGTVTLQREVPAATEAQLKAVDATISEAVKNGTTAGAMGAGALAYAEAQMAEERKAAQSQGSSPEAAAEAKDAAQKKDAKDAKDELFGDFDAAAGAMKAEAAAAAVSAGSSAANAAQDAPAEESPAPASAAAAPEQPWLSPDDDELPPLAEGELDAARREQPADLPSALKNVDLDLEDEAKKSVIPPAAPAYVPPLASEPVPHLTSEPVAEAPEAAKAPEAPETPTAPEAAAPEPPAEPPKAPESQAVQKQRAQTEALDAKLSLAGSFIGLGAKSEAQELLEEVAKSGSEAQRAQAAKLLTRLKAAAEGAGNK